MELMALLYDILQKARKEGLMSIEKDVEDPHSSPLFQKYPTVGNDHHVVEFITDYLRMMVSGNLNAHEIESLMDSEIETHHHEAHGPVDARSPAWPARLPAFGIVAAVLGVVNTMGSVGQPPAVLGSMIGSALVGTFLGILLAYGVVEPLGGLLEQKVDEGSKELQCIKTTLLASMQGYAPQVAVEFGRKVLYSTERPTFSELEGHVKGKRQEVSAWPATPRSSSRSSSSAIKKGGHGQHGGAWKIAYADFVTAMMAFFLLMWLLGSTTEGDKKGIADFFNSPLKVAMLGGSGAGDSSHVVKGGGADLTRTTARSRRATCAASARRSTARRCRPSSKRAEIARLEALKKKVEDALAASPKLAAMRSQIRLDMTRDGLRIQIVDEQNRPMFDSGSAVVKPYMRELLREIGKVLQPTCPTASRSRATPTRSRSAPASAATATGSSRATAPTRRGASWSPAACPRTACCSSRGWRRAPVRSRPIRPAR